MADLMNLLRDILETVQEHLGDEHDNTESPAAAPQESTYQQYQQAPVNRQEAPATSVQISLRVNGGALGVGAHGRDINSAVETALTNLGRQHGIWVLPGSVEVTGL